MPRLADHDDQAIAGDEARQHVVLVVARESRFVAAVALGEKISQSSRAIT